MTRYRRMMAAFNAGDFSTISELVAPDVDYVVPGKSPLAGHTHDIAGLIEMLRRGKDLSGGTLQLDLRSVVADAMFADVAGGATPTLVTTDVNVAGRLARTTVVDPPGPFVEVPGRSLRDNLTDNYPNGHFTIEILGHRLRVAFGG